MYQNIINSQIEDQAYLEEQLEPTGLLSDGLTGQDASFDELGRRQSILSSPGQAAEAD